MEIGGVRHPFGKPGEVDIEYLSWLLRNREGKIMGVVTTRYWDNKRDILADINIDSNIKSEIRDALLTKIVTYIVKNYPYVNNIFVELLEEDIEEFQNFLRQGFKEYERDSDFSDGELGLVTIVKSVVSMRVNYSNPRG